MLCAQRLTGATCPVMGSGHSGLQKSKEEVHHMDIGATVEIKEQALCRWTVGARQLTEDLGWRLVNCEIATQTWPPSLQSHRKGEK